MGRMMTEFPNDWEAIQDLPSHRFNQIPAETVLNNAGSWDLPSNVHSIIRWECSKSGKVYEKTYRTPAAAEKRCSALANNGDRYVVLYHEQMSSNYEW